MSLTKISKSFLSDTESSNKQALFFQGFFPIQLRETRHNGLVTRILNKRPTPFPKNGIIQVSLQLDFSSPTENISIPHCAKTWKNMVTF